MSGTETVFGTVDRFDFAVCLCRGVRAVRFPCYGWVNRETVWVFSETAVFGVGLREVIQGLEKEFPKLVNREFFRVNRDTKRSFQGLSLGEQGNSV